MKEFTDNAEMMQLMERKQDLLLKIRAAITLDRIDLVMELSYELQLLIFEEKKYIHESKD